MKTILLTSLALLAAGRLHADFVLLSGDYRAVYQSGVNYAVSEIFYKNVLLCNRMGYNGSILAPEPGKFIGAGHKEGGREKLVFMELEVDGKKIAEPCGEYRGENLVFRRVTRLDNVELTTIAILSPAGYESRVQFKTLGVQKVASFYIHQYCWSEKLTEFLAVTSDNQRRNHTFTSGNGWFLHNVSAHAKWFALYSPPLQTGLVCGYDSATVQAGHSRFWDRINTHKLYYQPTYPKVLEPEFVSTVYTLRFQGFSAASADWRKTADGIAGTVTR